jgi:hypothetical protein
MQRIVGGIEIEDDLDDLLWRVSVRLQKQIDKTAPRSWVPSQAIR